MGADDARGPAGRSRRGGGRSARVAREPRERPPASREEQLEAARAVALRVLGGAPRTSRQLRDALVRRGHEEDVVDELVARYEEVGLLDDAALAGAVARTRLHEKGLSRRGIAAELRRKGVGEDDVARAVEQIDDEAEAEAARLLVRRHLARTAGLDRDVRVRRTLGALGRKGHAPGAVMRIITEELGLEDELLGDDLLD